jgi:RNA polymerase sigma-70 factor (ECF subfamily)
MDEVTEIRKRIYHFALKSVKNSEIANDIAQDTMMAFIEAFEKDETRDMKNLTGFAYGILKNKIADHFKLLCRQGNKETQLSENLACDTPDPAASLLLENERRQIAELVLRLKPLDRCILDLYYYQSQSLQEIAARFKRSPKYIAIRKCRAMKKLKKWLK